MTVLAAVCILFHWQLAKAVKTHVAFKRCTGKEKEGYFSDWATEKPDDHCQVGEVDGKTDGQGDTNLNGEGERGSVYSSLSLHAKDRPRSLYQPWQLPGTHKGLYTSNCQLVHVYSYTHTQNVLYVYGLPVVLVQTVHDIVRVLTHTHTHTHTILTFSLVCWP